MISTLLFDLDGTLVHTDHLHFEAFRTVLAPHGITLDWATYRAFIMGRSNAAIGAHFLPHLSADRHQAVMGDKEAEYRNLVRDLEPAAGLLDLLDWADAHGAGCAVVTNAPRDSAEAVLVALRIRHRFRAFVMGDEVASPKPHPMPYLTALSRLGGIADRSVAFEDSPSGVASARTAGLPVVGLSADPDGKELREHGASLVITDYRDPLLMSFLRRRLSLETHEATP